MPGAIATPIGRHPRVMPAHPRGSAWLTALARAISKTCPGDGSLEREQRVCKIVGHVYPVAGWDLHPLKTRTFSRRNINIFIYLSLSPSERARQTTRPSSTDHIDHLLRSAGCVIRTRNPGLTSPRPQHSPC